LESFLTLGFFLVGLGAIVATGIMMWRLISGFTSLVKQNALTMAATGAIADKVSRQHDEVMATMERLQQQHNEIVEAIVKLTEKIGMMADG
jgi:hypothetical protein